MKTQITSKMRFLVTLFVMLVLAIPMWAQKGNRITGKVVDENGEPLPGAVVMLNGQTSSAVETDLDGLFDIVASKDKNVLTVSMIGFETLSVEARIGQRLELVAHESAYSLDGVVFYYCPLKLFDSTKN